jgi:NAD+ kinase
MRFGIIGNLQKPGLRDAVRRLMDILDRSRTPFCLERELGQLVGAPPEVCTSSLEECLASSEMMIALGGDGTILVTARLVGLREVPILGINLGKLGFLAEISPEEMDEALGEILEERYLVEERLVLEGTTPARPGKVYHAVNDFVVDKSRSSRIIDIETHIDGTFAVTYRADGLIISTPTGSTGYALSSGGPIVTPQARVFGITPISPHTLSGRPIIVPDGSMIRVVVRSHSEEVLFSADGQIEEFLKPPAEINIRRAPYTLKLVKRMDRSYFDVLRAKLFWGQDARV